MNTLTLITAILFGILMFVILSKVVNLIYSFWLGYSSHRKKPTLSEKAYERGKYLALYKNIDDKEKEGNK